jgi:hypothetical protein
MMDKQLNTTPNRRSHVLASIVIVGVFVVLSLMAVGVRRHPASVQGAGNGLLRMDIALLLLYGVASIWIWYEPRPEVSLSIRIGTRLGGLLGAVDVANHTRKFNPLMTLVLTTSRRRVFSSW